MQLKQALSLTFFGVTLALTGCSNDFVTPPSTGELYYVQGVPFKGTAMGGQQPIGSSHLYIYAAAQTGYGNSSISLIQNDTIDTGLTNPSQLDGNGNYYIITDATTGNFNLGAHQYSCPSGSQVYLFLTQGNVGNGNNTAISEMAVMGTCTSSGFSQLTGSYVYMNEVSTVAAAYALAGFATDSTHVSSANTSLSIQGLQNAFATAANIYNINAGAAQSSLATTPAGNGTVPATMVNSMADMLAACVNSTGSSSTNCSSLMTNSGTTTGGAPTNVPETSTAAINMAHHPGSNVANLFTLVGSTSPFQPIASPTPTDLAVIIGYTFATRNNPANLAIDAAGNIWITNNNIATVSELSTIGKVLSGTGYTNSNMLAPTGIAVDANGNVWVADESDALLKFTVNSSTHLATSSTAYTGAALTGDPQSVAIDSHGNVWVDQNSAVAVQFNSSGTQTVATSGGALKTQTGAQSVALDNANDVFIANYKELSLYDSASSFSSSGTPFSSGTGYGYSLSQRSAQGVAIDKNEQFWMTNSGSNSVDIGNNSGSTVNTATGSTAAGLCTPEGIAFDGSSNAWIANNCGTLSAMDDTGAAISGSTGYTGTVTTMSGIGEAAVDGSGNVWALNNGNGLIYEFVGAATPVLTPLVAGVSSTPATKP